MAYKNHLMKLWIDLDMQIVHKLIRENAHTDAADVNHVNQYKIIRDALYDWLSDDTDKNKAHCIDTAKHDTNRLFKQTMY